MSNLKPSPPINPKKSGTRWLAAALAALVLFSHASAQTAAPEQPQRWLLIFDTASTMKKFVPATTAELQNLFFGSISGQVRVGDSVGVWTFGKKLYAGEYPQLTWMPGQAAADAASLTIFLKNQHYVDKTTYAALHPVLDKVIAHSQRLTVIIFCDGRDNLTLTPYDKEINQTFREIKAVQKDLKVPFVLVVRTQEGQFVGATVNMPPGSLDLPPFPLLPQPVETVPANPAQTPVNAPPPVVPAPSLIIVGTNVLTNTNGLKQ
ncbi:MAG: hypothetical protein ABSF34_11900 [Verrucomicrobiota bacterium]